MAYAVGEYGGQTARVEEDTAENDDGRDNDDDDDDERICTELTAIKEHAYEVVTAWVHPR